MEVEGHCVMLARAMLHRRWEEEEEEEVEVEVEVHCVIFRR